MSSWRDAMYRTGLWVVLALVILASCSRGDARGGGLAGDGVDGGGVTYSDIFRISASVSEGGEVTGYLAVKNPPDYTPAYVIEGPVTCLNVVGNLATIGGVLERFDEEGYRDASRFHGWLFSVEDNAARPGVPDRISYQYLFDEPTTGCPIPTQGLRRVPMSEGHVTVVQGPR
jgi:hypothetical protein